MRWMRSPLLIIAVLPLAACTTWRPIPVHRISTEIEPRDVVKVGTYGGRELRFSVTEVEPTALIGDEVRVRMNDIQWVKKRELNRRKTWIVIGSVALGVLVAAAVVVAAAASSEGTSTPSSRGSARWRII